MRVTDRTRRMVGSKVFVGIDFHRYRNGMRTFVSSEIGLRSDADIEAERYEI